MLRVYSHDADATDLLFIGYVAMDLKNGKHVAGEFIGRVTIANPQSDSPRLQFYTVWAVSYLLETDLVVMVLTKCPGYDHPC